MQKVGDRVGRRAEYGPTSCPLFAKSWCRSRSWRHLSAKTTAFATNICRAICTGTGPHKLKSPVAITNGGTMISAADLERLSPQIWLNDILMLGFFELLRGEEVVVLHTYFFPPYLEHAGCEKELVGQSKPNWKTAHFVSSPYISKAGVIGELPCW